jgi:hypothetical protein
MPWVEAETPIKRNECCPSGSSGRVPAASVRPLVQTPIPPKKKRKEHELGVWLSSRVPA